LIADLPKLIYDYAINFARQALVDELYIDESKKKDDFGDSKKKDAIEKYETAILLLSNLKEVANEMQDKLALSNCGKK